jgi:FkbM family methyltransferase
VISTRIKRQINRVLRTFGYTLSRYTPGRDWLGDVKYFLKDRPTPLILDVGANRGQSVDQFKKAFPGAIIHSFEPSPTTYAMLSSHCKGIPNTSTWNYGVGSQPGSMPLLENTDSEMSSFLEPSEFAFEKGRTKQVTQVKVVTLDAFTAEHGMDFVDLLKVDTQGFELEVFKGATRLMNENKIALLLFEFNFSDMYKGQPSFHAVYDFLHHHNFSLVTFYQLFYQKKLVSWTDMLFINRDFYRDRVEQDPAW